MSYITLANTNKIIFQSDLRELNLDGEIYKIPIYFFSKYEENALLAIQELLKDPEKYFKDIYKPYEPVDTFTKVYEGRSPAYHIDSKCPNLLSDYHNFEIPSEIKEKGKEAVKEFRGWFETVKYLLEDKPDAFVERLRIRYGIQTNPKAIDATNSGATVVEHLTVEQLEAKIDHMIKEAGRFYYSSDKHKAILSKFSKFTFLAYKEDPIDNNYTGYSDVEVKELLTVYDRDFKKPLKQDLIEYYRLKLNPEIKMEGEFLEQLGFKPCRHCHSDGYVSEIDPCEEAYEKYMEAYTKEMMRWEKREKEQGGGLSWNEVNSPPVSYEAFMEQCKNNGSIPSFMKSDGLIKRDLE